MDKDKFIRDLIDCLNEENEDRITYNKNPLNVCEMVSVVEQKIDEFEEFVSDIKTGYCINGYFDESEDGYSNGKVRIFIEDAEKEEDDDLYFQDTFKNYYYYIEFLDDPRLWGYCECEPTDKEYNKVHKCCGSGCDWYAPAFRLYKEYDLGHASWDGSEKDYWEYEKKFYSKQENKNKKVEEYEKKQRKKRIQEELERLNKQLNELDE